MRIDLIRHLQGDNKLLTQKYFPVTLAVLGF